MRPFSIAYPINTIAAMNELSNIQLRRLTLYFIDNLTHRQIAEIEVVDKAAIGRSIKRALNQLCILLAE